MVWQLKANTGLLPQIVRCGTGAPLHCCKGNKGKIDYVDEHSQSVARGVAVTRPWMDLTWQQMALDALRSTLDVDADMKRTMVEFLFETGLWDRDRLTWDAAITKFNSCLNPAKPEKFSLLEIWALAKRFDRHDLALAMIADLGYETPRRRTTEERRQELLERIASAYERSNTEIAAYMAELLRLGTEGPPLRLHPAIVEGKASFSQMPDGLGPPMI